MRSDKTAAEPPAREIRQRRTAGDRSSDEREPATVLMSANERKAALVAPESFNGKGSIGYRSKIGLRHHSVRDRLRGNPPFEARFKVAEPKKRPCFATGAGLRKARPGRRRTAPGVRAGR